MPRSSIRSLLVGLGGLCACNPPGAVPPTPENVPDLLSPSDPAGQLAAQLAPTLHLQPDEPFKIVRPAAVVHPSRPIVAYHLLWEHDVNGQWVPWAKPNDEEEIWVG